MTQFTKIFFIQQLFTQFKDYVLYKWMENDVFFANRKVFIPKFFVWHLPKEIIRMK